MLALPPPQDLLNWSRAGKIDYGVEESERKSAVPQRQHSKGKSDRKSTETGTELDVPRCVLLRLKNSDRPDYNR